MPFDRRDFLRLCLGSAAALGLPLSVVGRIEEVLAADGPLPTIVWLNGANCTGCTVSLANRISIDAPTDVADLLLNFINLAFHPNLMGAAGDLAVQTLHEATSGPFILAVNGGIPTALDGHTCILWSESGHEVTAKEAVQSLAARADAILCIGSCASFGGIPAGDPNPTGIVSVSGLTGRPTINIPGCPTHPDWIVWTVAQLLAGVTPALDDQGRPVDLFRRSVHERCPRKGTKEAHDFGMDGLCMKELGCEGPRTKADCPTRLWNNGANWCIGANTVCMGCTEDGFPDAFSPFFKYEFETHTAFEITRAEWNRETMELHVEGKGREDTVVVLEDAFTDARLGATNVDHDANWSFRLSNPPAVPCRVRVESGSQMLEQSVENSQGCGPVGRPPKLRIGV